MQSNVFYLSGDDDNDKIPNVGLWSVAKSSTYGQHFVVKIPNIFGIASDIITHFELMVKFSVCNGQEKPVKSDLIHIPYHLTHTTQYPT